ncbi:MAG: DUF1501 domain-containing protein [Gammaproteobacteria bacterium]|nr:DUF1501 domain-containing protein [Gammaproteobacteria bacterium]
MHRRAFLKSAGVLGVTAAASPFFAAGGLIRQARAMPAIEQVNFVPPAVLPQIIHVFLYGGPSELAGNLSNIAQINTVSQTAYPDELLRAVSNDNGQITRHGFWQDAGGAAMEDMLAAGDMSVYRTINRRKNNTRAHRPSVFSCQKGSLDIEQAPGVGTTLAAVLNANRSLLEGTDLLGGRTLLNLVLPFISFEGTTTAFAPDPDNRLPMQLKGLSLDERFDNPYTRGDNDHDAELQALINQVVDATQRSRFDKVAEGFEMRRDMEALIGNLQSAADNPLPVVPGNEDDPDIDPATRTLRYPDNNGFSARIKAAVTLAIENPDSLYITVGGGLGGWDDHNSAIERYEPRMQQLMQALRVATKHIRYSDVAYGGTRRTDNIIINVHGDFGRNVNLNNSAGWDHGNNQNLYTFGGAGVRQGGRRALGKVVGKTQIFGSAKENRLFTEPTDDSYEAEPMSIAASVYRYFGVRNPQVLTRDDEMNPAGDAPLDETVPGEASMFG